MPEQQKKPYNPYPLAAGYAAETLPDAKTASVFNRLCAHTDFLGGSVKVSVAQIAKETHLSPRSVDSAIKALKRLGRVSRKQRGIGSQKGGRQSAITTVHCTEEELQKAGANEENYFGRGGCHGFVTPMSQPDSKRKTGGIQNANRVDSKRKSDGFKTQRVAQEPLQSEPFLPEPVKTEPSLAKTQNQDDFFSPKGKKENPKATPQGVSPLPTPKGTVGSPAVRPTGRVALKPEVVTKFRAFGCPDSCLDLIEAHTKIATILNGETPGGCSNPITAYVTIAGRNPKFARLWMPNLSPQKEILGSSEQEVEDMVAMKKHLDSMPLEERDYRAAQYWQMGFTLEQTKALGLFATAPGHDGDTCKDELGICKACDAVHRKNLVECYTVAMSTGKGSAAQAWRREHGIPESDNAVVGGGTAMTVPAKTCSADDCRKQPQKRFPPLEMYS